MTLQTYAPVDRIAESGWIVGAPNAYVANVTVRLDMRQSDVDVYMPWIDRPENFEAFLCRCSGVLRLSASVRMLPDGRRVAESYTLWVHPRAMQEQMKRKGCIEGEVHALAALKHYAPTAQLAKGFDVFRVDCCLLAQPKTPEAWNATVPLYERQRRAVGWMCSIEAAIVCGQNHISYSAFLPVCTDTFTKADNDAVWYDMRLGAFRQAGPMLKTRFRGACLCDAVGTGKTACALALMASSDLHPISSQISQGMPRARGTCVIVPINIPQQWAQEVEKFLPRFRVIVLTSSRDLRTYSMADIADAEVVIVTTNFLRNANVRDQIDDVVRSALNEPSLDKKDCRLTQTIRAAARSLVTADSWRNLPAFVEFMFWPRIIVDEVHEYLQQTVTSRDRLRAMRGIQARVFWGLTATPNTSSGDAMQGLYPLLLEPKIVDDDHTHHPCLQVGIETALLGSFAEADSKGVLNETLHLVRLTAREQAIIDGCPLIAVDQAVHLSTCPPRACQDEEFSLERMRRESCQSISQLWQAADDLTHEMICASLQGNLSGVQTLRGAVAESERQYREAVGAYVFFENRLGNVTQTENDCPICYDPLPRAMLQCGHLLCAKCASTVRNTQNMCPICRVSIQNIYHVSSSKAGSKQNAICSTVDAIVASGGQVLIFSQWTALLEGVCRVLEARSAVLTGPTARRGAAVRRFREKGLDVLGMHLERSSTGLHLAEATHVVLAHCVVGPAHDALAMEQQAVGRALRDGQTHSVHVHHFIAQGTQEETLWRQRRKNTEAHGSFEEQEMT